MNDYSVLSLIFCIFGTCVFGDKSSDLEPVIVVETRTERPVMESSPWVSSVSSDELNRRQIKTIGDALNSVPGMTVVSSGQLGSQSSLYSRGANSDHTTFLFEGRKLNSGFSGTYNLGQLPLVGVSSLEVLRGSSSVQYGAEGIGGAVNLRSDRSGVYENGELGIELGSYNSVSLDALSEFSNGRIGLSYFDTENDRINANYENLAAIITWSKAISNEWELDLVGTGYLAQMGVPGTISNPTSNNFQDNENYLFSPGVSTSGDDWNWRSFYSLSNGEVVSTWGKQNLLANQFETEWSGEINEILSLTLGANFQANEYEDKGSAVDERVDNFAQFALASISIGDQTEFNMGLRHEDYSSYGRKLTYTIFARQEVFEGTNLFARYGTNFAPPTALDMFGWAGANPNLSPEEGSSYELGIRFFAGWAEVEVVTFRNDYKNLIEFYDPDGNFIGVMKNVSEASSEGLELVTQIPFSNAWTGNIGYTYLEASSKNGQRLARRPRHTFSLGLEYQENPLIIGFELIDTKDRMDNDSFKGEDYLLCRSYSNYTFSNGWRGTLRFENLFNEQYEEVIGYPSLGFGAYGGLKYSF